MIGIKIFESDNIRMWRVRVDDLKNVGDDSHWVCQQEYELPNAAVSNESIDFAVFRILQEEGKTTGA